MFSKSTLLGTLFGAITFNLLGWGIYAGLAGEYFSAQMLVEIEEAMDPMMIGLGCLLMSFAMANLYSRWSRNGYSFNSGLSFGLWIGFFAGFGIGCMQYGNMHLIRLEGVVIDGLIALPFYALVGGSIGWAFQLTSAKNAA